MSFSGKSERVELSLNQKNIWYQEQSAAGTPINNIACSIKFSGLADFFILRDAVNRIVESDPSLRTQVETVDGTLMQYHAEYTHFDIQHIDFSPDPEGYFTWAQEEAKKPIYAENAPLYRFTVGKLGENTMCLFVCTHHIISDGYSQLKLCSRIASAYLDLVVKNDVELPVRCDYFDFVNTGLAYISSDSFKNDDEFWKSRIASIDGPLSFKTSSSVGFDKTSERVTLRFDDETNKAIFDFYNENGVSPVGTFYMALSAVKSRQGSKEKLSIGAPIVNRKTMAEKNTTGMFVSTIPFYFDVNDKVGFEENSELYFDAWTDTLKHQRFPYSEMKKYAQQDKNLFDIVISFQDSSFDIKEREQCKVDGFWHHSGIQNEQLVIQITDFANSHNYTINYDFLSSLFSVEEIEDIHKRIGMLIKEGVQNPSKPICEIELCDETEKKTVIDDFNSCGADKYDYKAPYSFFADFVAKNPDSPAVTFEGDTITYSEIAEIGQKVAASIGESGKTCAILLEKSPKLYGALAGVMQSGNTFCIISADQPIERVMQMTESASVDVVITTSDKADELANAGCKAEKFIDINNLGEKSGKVTEVSPEDTAYIVFTSGSTGKPKAVEVSNRSFSNFVSIMGEIYPDGALLSLCNVGFDAFAIEGSVALLNGRHIVIPSHKEKDNPNKLAGLIEENKVEFVSMTPSRLSALMNSKKFRDAASNFRTIICGGEAYPADMLTKLRKYTGAEIFNQYGPSEATVAVSMAKLNDTDTITAGKPFHGCRLYVLDGCRHPLPVGSYGELYIGGTCVSKGYKNMPEQTKGAFFDDPFNPGHRMYRTGDIARWTADGNIVIGGRTDSQMKIRGIRIEPEEISSCLSKYPGVAAFTLKLAKIAGSDNLIGYYVSKKELPETDMLAFAAERLPRYMIPSRILKIDAIPLTENGKIDYKKLPVPDDISQKIEAETEIQKKIVSIFREVLGNEEIHAGSDYFMCGGDSLNAMETLSRIEEAYGITMPVTSLYACSNALRIEKYILEHSDMVKASEKPEHIQKSDRYKLSATQSSLYFESLMDESGKAYLMPSAFILTDEVDTDRLNDAFCQMIDEDPIFRTSFGSVDGEVLALVSEKVDFSLSSIQAESREEAISGMLEKFDYSKAPLLRAGIYHDQNGERLLIVCIHHLICDGLSVPVIMNRLNDFYSQGKTDDHLTFFDCIYYQDKVTDNKTEAQLNYWKKKLAGCPQYTDIPSDFPRPDVFNRKGGFVSVELAPEITEVAEELCKKYSVSENMLFSGAFGILFSRMSSQNAVVFGVPVSGRRTIGFDKAVGPLMRTVPLMVKTDCSLDEFFRDIKTSTYEMIDNSDCPIADIIDVSGVSKFRNRNPLYQILIQTRPISTDNFCIGPRKMAYLPLTTGFEKLDLEIEICRNKQDYTIEFGYYSSAYDEKTIESWGQLIPVILTKLAKTDGKVSVNDISFDFDECDEEYVPFEYETLQSQIVRKSHALAKDIAVISNDETYTFAQLDEYSARIVSKLKKAGVKKGDYVGLVSKRNFSLLASLIAILKCGAAYVPFLDSYPKERIKYMMELATVSVVLCDSESVETAKLSDCHVCVADMSEEPDYSVEENEGRDTIYVLFTSGSTGKPKGVSVCHDSIANLLNYETDMLKEIDGAVLCTSNYTFDIFITESLLALAQGRTVILANDEQMLHPWMLAELILKYHATITQYTPSRLAMCLKNYEFAEAISNIKFTIVAGENVPSSLVKEFKSRTRSVLFNMYGPTEAAVYVSAGELNTEENVTVGKAITNCDLLILDENQNRVLPGQKGELYISGVCLGKGYVSRPDLTEKLFVKTKYLDGKIMYRSGDIFRKRSDGLYECFGRSDNQIKFNGIRVELDEINEALVACGAEKAVTIALKNPDGSVFIEAAVTPANLNVFALSKSVSKMLPVYMVPSKIVPFDKLPYNASGKADVGMIRIMLAEVSVLPVKNTTSAEKKAPSSENEKTVFDIWGKCLGNRDFSVNDSFFDIGGSSLTALNVISEYHNNGIEMTLRGFFDNPTVSEQAKILGGSNENGKSNTEFELMSVPDVRYEKNVPHGDILLTGATGFLGSHILAEIIRNKSETVYCLVRDGNHDRLMTTIRAYFGNELDNCDRIVTVKGDILLDHFGMSDTDYNALGSKIGCVINSAADVRHYANDGQLTKTNVDGVKSVIDFAMTFNAELDHVSTESISGERIVDNPDEKYVYTEADFDIGQNRENEYVRSKLEAERLIFKAIEKGLIARSYRVGRLVGRYTDGVFQLNKDKNAFWRIAQAIQEVGAISGELSEIPIELTPIDVCAEKIVALLHSPEPVYHIVSHFMESVIDVVRYWDSDFRVVDTDEFKAILSQKTLEQPALMASLIDFINQKGVEPNIKLSSERTEISLKNAGYVRKDDIGQSLCMFNIIAKKENSV